MDRGHGRAGEFRQALEHVLAAPQRVVDGALGVERLELADVGAGDEAAVLGRTDDQPLRRIQGEALENGVQLQQDLLGQRIHRLAGAVQRQHDHAIVAGFGVPMLEAQSVQASDHAAPSDAVRGEGYHPGRV